MLPPPPAGNTRPVTKRELWALGTGPLRMGCRLTHTPQPAVPPDVPVPVRAWPSAGQTAGSTKAAARCPYSSQLHPPPYTRELGRGPREWPEVAVRWAAQGPDLGSAGLLHVGRCPLLPLEAPLGEGHPASLATSTAPVAWALLWAGRDLRTSAHAGREQEVSKPIPGSACGLLWHQMQPGAAKPGSPWRGPSGRRGHRASSESRPGQHPGSWVLRLRQVKLQF